MRQMIDLIKKLEKQNALSLEEYELLIKNSDDKALREYLFSRAVAVRKEHYGNFVFVRGLIEFTNYCKNNCYYCGIRASNKNARRYRLAKDRILQCVNAGYDIGFRTFVLQGGEDGYFSASDISDVVREIKNARSDVAVTLSFGEYSKEVYQEWFDAGADRYLLRHETADNEHYSLLHPSNLTLKKRMQCLYDLKEIGYQVGCGFMVGSPYQTHRSLAKDLVFIQEFKPHMVGIGPFIPHCDTPFALEKSGSVDLTLFLLALVRLILPKVLLPSTTALGSLQKNGRELGILAGANVCMPNLSPIDVREKYSLYNNKLISGAECCEQFENLRKLMEDVGYQVVISRGDYGQKIIDEKNNEGN